MSGGLITDDSENYNVADLITSLYKDHIIK